MELLGIEAREIQVTFRMSLLEVIKLRDALSKANIDTPQNEKEEEASNFLIKEFYPFVTELVNRGSGDGT